MYASGDFTLASKQNISTSRNNNSGVSGGISFKAAGSGAMQGLSSASGGFNIGAGTIVVRNSTGTENTINRDIEKATEYYHPILDKAREQVEKVIDIESVLDTAENIAGKVTGKDMDFKDKAMDTIDDFLQEIDVDKTWKEPVADIKDAKDTITDIKHETEDIVESGLADYLADKIAVDTEETENEKID